MAFTVQDFQDLIRLLKEQPQWLEELRRWVLTDELLSLPALARELTQRVETLAEAQRRTEERLEALTLRVDALAEAQKRTEERLEALTLRVDALAEAQKRTEERLEALTLRVDALAEAQARTESEVKALAEAQRRTEERLEALTLRVDALAEAQARTESEVKALAEAQARTEGEIKSLAEAQARMESAIRELTDAQRRTEEALQGVILRVDELRGEMLEIRYRERAHAYFSKLIRRTHVLSSEELYRLIDEAIAKGQLTEEEGDELILADAIIRGVWREDKQPVYLVVEVSWGVGMSDVERARERARLLARTGVRAIPVVAGKWISSDAEQQAKAFQVWQVRDGMVTSP